MEILIKLNGAPLPQCAHSSDTGADLVAVSEPTIVGEKEGADLWRRIDYLEYETGISVAPLPLCVEQWAQRYYSYLQVFPRSSISKTNLVLVNSVGVIDNAYRGTIKLRFRYLLQPCDLVSVSDEHNPLYSTLYQRVDPKRLYHAGDKIAQLVAAWKEEIQWKVVNSLPESARGEGGFGSSDIKTNA